MASIIRLSGSGTGGTESAVANIDVPMNGLILGAYLNHSADMDADGDTSLMQVSFGTVATTGNDSRQIIAESRLAAQLTTSGSPMTAVNHYVNFGNGVPVGMGERIYLHFIATASLPSSGAALLIFDFDEARPSVRRR